jgi:carboxypeptidase D
MMDLILSEPWVISANYHDGAVVAAYPYNDYRDDNTQEGMHQTPDDEVFKHLASTYADNHGTMANKWVLLHLCQVFMFLSQDWLPQV